MAARKPEEEDLPFRRHNVGAGRNASYARLADGPEWGAAKMLSANRYAAAALLLILFVSRLIAQNPLRRHSGAPDPQPEVRIPVYGLGYQPPGPLPAFQFYSLVSLHYIDAHTLLFTFNTTGLIQRDTQCSTEDSERLVRAVVLDLPSGKAIRQTEWKLYDFANFVWSLGNGQLLFRRCSQLFRLDASLKPTPFIDMGISVVALGLSPDRSVMLLEGEPPEKATAAKRPSAKGDMLSQLADSILGERSRPQINLDFIRIHPLAVIARSQAPFAVDLPILSEGFLETAGVSPHHGYDIVEQSYHNVQRPVVTIQSWCAPQLTAITDNVFVAQTCKKGTGELAYQAFNLQGTRLWQIPFGEGRVRPQFLRTQDGAHFAIESLHANHPVAALDRLSGDVIDTEILDVYETLSGTRIGSLRITPVYTSGQNAAFSPGGKHIAVLRDGAIEIYALDTLAKEQQPVGK